MGLVGPIHCESLLCYCRWGDAVHQGSSYRQCQVLKMVPPVNQHPLYLKWIVLKPMAFTKLPTVSLTGFGRARRQLHLFLIKRRRKSASCQHTEALEPIKLHDLSSSLT